MLQIKFKNNRHKLINTEGLGNQAWNQSSSDTTLGIVDSSSVMFDIGWTRTGPIPKPNPTMTNQSEKRTQNITTVSNARHLFYES